MKEILLTRGLKAIVDDEDFENLNQHNWQSIPNKNNNKFYAVRAIYAGNKKQKRIWMHKEIMQTPDGTDTDHIDGNGLNNCRSNLRQCTRTQNLGNQPKNRKSASRFKGVSIKRASTWCAQIQFQKKNNHLGYFLNEEDAAKAYDKAAIKFYGEFALTNFPKENYL